MLAVQVLILVSENGVVALLPEGKSAVHVVFKTRDASCLRRQFVAEELDVKQILKVAEVKDLHHRQVSLKVVSLAEVNKSQTVLGSSVCFFDVNCCKLGQPIFH